MADWPDAPDFAVNRRNVIHQRDTGITYPMLYTVSPERSVTMQNAQTEINEMPVLPSQEEDDVVGFMPPAINGLCYTAGIFASVWPIGTAIAGPTALGCAIMYFAGY